MAEYKQPRPQTTDDFLKQRQANQALAYQLAQMAVTQLTNGGELTPIGAAVVKWLDQNAVALLSASPKDQHTIGDDFINAVKTYVGIVTNQKVLNAPQFFTTYNHYAALILSAYTDAVKQQAAQQAVNQAAAQTTAQPTESAAIEIKRPPKLVDRNGFITPAGITLATILIEAYHGGKLPATDSTRAFIAHTLMMRQTPQTFFRNNPRYSIPLTVVAVQLAQTELGALREELDRIKAKTTPRKKNTPPAAKPEPVSTGLVGLDGKPLAEGKAVKLAESAADDIPEDQLLRVRAQISRMIAAES